MLLLLLGTTARASRFEDLGPSLGLPPGSPGATIGRTLVAGVSAVDIDGDGDDDLLTTEPLLGFSVYLRDGAGFVRAPQWSASLLDVYGHVAFDMDGDGDSDVLVAANGSYRLYDNVGNKLVEASLGRLPTLPGWSFTATAVDIDGDRDLDLLVARYIDRADFPTHRCHDNLVLENDGRGHFRDVSAAVGIRGALGCSFVLVAHDVDADDDLDMIAINDFSQFVTPNVLWRNVGREASGLPRFVAESESVGLDLRVYGMGLAVGDLDENGRNDYFVTNVGAPALLEMSEQGRFVPNARGTHLRYGPELNLVTWVTRMVDLDRDGHLDVLAAVGKLTAAAFIDNPVRTQPLWLRGQADGSLKVTTGALEIVDNSGRDFAFTDVDGDGRPELVVVHIHGGVSVMRDTASPPLATTLVLTPSATGPGAAGAFVTLRCGDVTRTRTVVAGGDYGNDDAGEVEVSFPPPCDGPGLTLTGQVRWPSGYVQSVVVTTGARTAIGEPPWLTVTPGALEVDLSGHAGAFEAIALEAFGAVEVGASVALGERHWRWPVAGQGAATIALDGRPLGALVRLSAAYEVWFEPSHPVAGQPLTVYTRGVSAVGWDGEAQVALTPFDAELASGTLIAPAAGEHTLSLVTTEGVRAQTVVVTPRVDVLRSEVYARELHVPALEVGLRTLRIRFRLRDSNDRPVALDLAALQVMRDGELIEPLDRGFDGEVPTLLVPHALLEDGSVLQPMVDGEAMFGPFVVAHIAEGDTVAALVTPERFCQMSEPYLRADGNDRGAVLVQLYDASGTRLPDLGVGPVFEAEGVSVATSEVVTGYGGWLVPVQAGTVPGEATLRVRLPGQAVPVSCSFPLWPALTVPRVVAGSPLETVFGPPEVDVPATFRFTPRDGDGLAIGSGVDFDFVIDGVDGVDGVDAEPRIVDGRAGYRGLGRYVVEVTPTRAGPLVVSAVARDGTVLASLAYELGGAAVEAGPEVDEASVEVVELEAEVVELEAETVELVAVEVDDAGGVEQDTVEVVAPDALDVVEVEVAIDDVDPEVSEAVERVTETDAEGPEVAEPHERHREGCVGGTDVWGIGGLVGSVLLARRGLRKRGESPSRPRRQGAPWRSR